MLGNNLKLFSLIHLSLILFMTLLTGCEMTWTDPFAPRRVGEWFFVPANPDNEFPISKSSETLTTRATMLNLSRQSDLSSSRSGGLGLSSGEKIKIESVTLLGKNDEKIVYTKAQLDSMNENAECQSIQSDIKDMVMMYPNMTIVCGRDFARIFQEASGISIKTTDDLERQFTSWGSHWSDVGGYRVVIQSFTL